MSITLERFANGDVNYVAKFNTNFDVLESAVNALSGQVAGQSAISSLPTLYSALFGSSAAVIGAGSYSCGAAGQIVTVQPGYAWLPAMGSVVRRATPANLDFTSAVDGDYYITADSTGTPIYRADATDAIYKVVKAAGVLTVTREAAVAWGFSDWSAAQNSSVNGVFTSLDARLEVIEAAAQDYFITGAFVSGVPVGGALLFAILPSVTATFAAAFAGSRAKAGVAATANTVLSIRKNGLEVGTITFAAGSTAGVFAAAAETVITNADELTIVNQNPADATLADIRFALHGTR